MKRLSDILIICLVAWALAPAALDAKQHKGGGGGGGGTGNEPVVITLNKNLLFGKAAAGFSSGGTVVLTPTTQAKTVTGGVTNFGGIVQAAEFQITGKKNRDVFVTLPSSVTITTAGGSMTLDTFTMNASNPIDLGNQGRATIRVGGTLRLSANQKAADYNGSFAVFADY